MGKLIFTNDTKYNREASNIEFTLPDDMDIFEYRIMCIRMAGAMGYGETSIKRAFGEEELTETESDLRFKEFLQTINVYTGSLLNTI